MTAYVDCSYLLNPYSVAIGFGDYLYVADAGYNIIDKIASYNKKIDTYGYCKFPYGVISYTGVKFNGPVGIAAGPDGSIYVANAGSDRTVESNYVAKISVDGSTSVLAGSNSPGSADGQGSAASFNFQGLSGMAVDPKGNIYVADSGNNKIRKISPSGYVATIAGSGDSGFLDGQGINSKFNNPTSIVVDSKGNLYVGDAGNRRIRMIATDGKVTTIAGGGLIVANEIVDGNGNSASFLTIFGMTIDKYDNIYVSDAWREGGWYWGKIRKISNGAVN